MARQVLPIVGAVVGAYFGNPQLGYAIGAIIGNAVDPQHIRGPRLREGPAQNFGEGGFRSVVRGTSWIWDCQVLEAGPIRRVTVEEQQGKGGGPVVETERGYQTYAIGLGEPLEAIRVIRKDGKIVYDIRPGSTILSESAAFAERFRFYTGSEDQLPDPDLEALPNNGVGNTPYYRGTAYLAFPNDDVTDLDGRIPTYEVEGVQSGTVTTGNNWFAGPVAENGAEGGSEDFYIAANTMAGLLTAEPQPLPAEGAGFLHRISVANGHLFFHRWAEGEDSWACVSADNGATWATCDNSLWGDSWARDVFWNGTAYYYGGVRSLNSTTWTAIPNLPSGGRVQLARDTDGLILVQDAAGVFHASYDNGTTWDAVFDFGSTYTPAIATDGERIAAVSSNGFAYYSDDGLESVAGGEASVSFGVYHSNGGWLLRTGISGGGGTGVGFRFASDGASWPDPPSAATAALFVDGETFDEMAASDGQGTWGAWHDEGAVPPERKLYGSTDNGMTWSFYGTLYGGAASLAYVAGSGISPIEAYATTIGAVVEEICERCGIPSTKLDLAELTEELAGVTLGGPYDGAGAITMLMPAYFFDLFEADRLIHAPLRGAAVVTTITADDLIEEPDENTLRGQDIEYPRKLLLKYLDPEQNYAAPAAPVQRNSPDIRVRGEAIAELPINMSRTQAFRVADRMLKVMWEDLNGEVTFSLPAGPFAWLTPTDCLGLSLRGALYRIRVEKVEFAAGVLKITARRDRQSAYTSVLTPVPLPPPTPPPPSLAGATQFAVLNIPGIIDADASLLGVRVAVCGLEGFAWTGCAVRLSSDGGASFSTVASITTRARIGTLLEPLSEASPYYTDTTNVVRVLMLDDRELESITEVQLYSEQNPAAIARPDGTAELIQFQNVVDDGDNEWSLSTLLRGRLNSSAAAHLAGAKFVMLDGTVFVPLPSALMGQELQLQFVSFGTSPEVAPVYAFTWSPVHSQLEFPAAHLFLERDGDDVLASAIPRHRFGTEDNPIAAPDWTGYRFTATDGSNTATVDTGATTPNATFDCTGWATPVTVTVALTNRITGPGPTLSEQIA